MVKKKFPKLDSEIKSEFDLVLNEICRYNPAFITQISPRTIKRWRRVLGEIHKYIDRIEKEFSNKDFSE